MSKLQAGTYPGRAIGVMVDGRQYVRFGYSEKGNEQIAVDLELLADGYEGTIVTWFGSFANEKAIEITMRTLRALGWQCDNLTVLEGLGSTEVDIKIGYEDYQGRERMRVEVWPVNRGGAKMKKKLEGKALHDFADRMKGYAVRSRPGATSAAPRRFNG